MYKSYEYRIYPTKEQEVLLSKHFGCIRFIYNYFLDKKQKLWASEKELPKDQRTRMTGFDMIKLSTELKKQEEYKWLKEVNSQSIQQAIVHLDQAYKNAFNSGFGFPKFKSKHKNRDSYTIPQHYTISFEDKTITLPKFKEPLKIRIDRKFDGKLCSATVKKVPSGKYFVSVLVDDGMEQPKTKQVKSIDEVLGVDVGLKDFIVDSTGNKTKPLNSFRKNEEKLAKAQRQHSKKQKDQRIKRKLG